MFLRKRFEELSRKLEKIQKITKNKSPAAADEIKMCHNINLFEY